MGGMSSPLGNYLLSKKRGKARQQAENQASGERQDSSLFGAMKTCDLGLSPEMQRMPLRR